MSRFNVIEYTGDRPAKNPTPVEVPDAKLAEHLAALMRHAHMLNARSEFQPVSFAPTARVTLDTFEADCDAAIVRAGDDESRRQMWNRPTRVVDAEAFIGAAEAAFRRIAPAIDRRVAELGGYRDTLAGRVAAALDTPARRTPEGLALASEVRAHVKAMRQPAQRTKFVAEAIGGDDLPTVAAVLHAPPVLSGLDAATHATMRDRAAARFAPRDSAQLAATETALSAVMAAGSVKSARFGEVLALRNAPVVRAARSVRALAEG